MKGKNISWGLQFNSEYLLFHIIAQSLYTLTLTNSKFEHRTGVLLARCESVVTRNWKRPKRQRYIPTLFRAFIWKL